MSAGIRAYLLETLLPFWAGRAWDAGQGGFVAELDLSGAPRPEQMRLCLVQSRCLHVFSHAAILSGEDWAQEAAERAFGFLKARLRHPGGLWVSAADPRAGGPRDERVDFYDQAFVLFSLAWRHRASGDPQALELAHETVAALDRELGDPVHGGWLESPRGALPRRQNPHMHLLEAMHALFEASGDHAWLDRANAVVALFFERFFDARIGTLREFFAADLSPAPGPAGDLREPGHQMEWVWLLLHHHRLTGDERVLAPAQALYQSACRHGIDASGHVVETMTARGHVIDPSHLLWPQTEAVKAALARHEMLGCDLAPARGFLDALWASHMPTHGPLWINRATPDGAPLSDAVPTRLLYHLVLCLAEWLRIDPVPSATAEATRWPIATEAGP